MELTALNSLTAPTARATTPVSGDAPDTAPPAPPADTVAPPQKENVKETPFIVKAGKAFMKVRENKVARVLMDTASGAALGAGIVALGASPVGFAVASAVLGGVVCGGVGAAVGGFAGFLIGGAQGNASKGAKRGALIGALTLGGLGAFGAYAGGFVQGAVVVQLAEYFGGGTFGGALAGGLFSGGMSAFGALTESDKKEKEAGQI